MSVVIDLHSVRAVKRLDARRRAAWSCASALAWGMAANAFFLITAALLVAFPLDARSPRFRSDIAGPDVMAFIAGVMLCISIAAFARGRARA